ncbi:MAG TPA: rod shape-determining protein MreD [Patescibacteria group bacterium]|nr:rod shape-determining protein MreD [Patescibacteria group bacterium]
MTLLLLWTGLIVVVTALQASMIPVVFLGVAKPDLPLILVVSCGLLTGKERAVGVAFFVGLLQDLTSGNIFGLNILAKMLTGYATGISERQVFKENFLLPVLAVAVASLLNSAVMLALLFLFGYRMEWMEQITYQVLPSMGYNILLCIPLHKLVYWMEIRRK